jgi:Tol biopolymer transport system component
MSHHRTSQGIICLVLTVLFLSACGAAVAPRTPVPPTATPAGRCRIVYEANGDIYVRDCDGSNVRRLTDHPAQDKSPAWSPDGQVIVFSSERDRQPTPDGHIPSSLYIMKADGSNLVRLTSEDSDDLFPTWSPDGSLIAFHHGCDLATINPNGSNLKMILLQSDNLCIDHPAWSPDSQRLVFDTRWPPSEPIHNWTVYIVSAEGTGLSKFAARFQAWDVIPTWSPDGQQIGLRVDSDGGDTKYYLLNADGRGQPVDVPSIPDSSFSWHWPQWSEK